MTALGLEESKLNRIVAAQLQKTKSCAMFAKGLCVDTQCRFAHSKDELRQAPDLWKTAMCRMFSKGQCADSTCRFSHGEQELRVTPSVYKTQLCNFFEKGHCKKGDRCRHAHGSAELRNFQPGSTQQETALPAAVDTSNSKERRSSVKKPQVPAGRIQSPVVGSGGFPAGRKGGSALVPVGAETPKRSSGSLAPSTICGTAVHAQHHLERPRSQQEVLPVGAAELKTPEKKLGKPVESPSKLGHSGGRSMLSGPETLTRPGMLANAMLHASLANASAQAPRPPPTGDPAIAAAAAAAAAAMVLASPTPWTPEVLLNAARAPSHLSPEQAVPAGLQHPSPLAQQHFDVSRTPSPDTYLEPMKIFLPFGDALLVGSSPNRNTPTPPSTRATTPTALDFTKLGATSCQGLLGADSAVVAAAAAAAAAAAISRHHCVAASAASKAAMQFAAVAAAGGQMANGFSEGERRDPMSTLSMLYTDPQMRAAFSDQVVRQEHARANAPAVRPHEGPCLPNPRRLLFEDTAV